MARKSKRDSHTEKPSLVIKNKKEKPSLLKKEKIIYCS